MWARWWLRLPMTIRVLVRLAPMLPFSAALPYAVFGHPQDPFGGLSGGLGGLIGVLIAGRLREPEYWQLDKQSRRRARLVHHTGEPSGDRQIDTMALGWLSRSAERERWNVVIPVSSVVMIATPVVAALRTGLEWWLIASLSGVLYLAFWSAGRRHEGPQARLDRFVDRMGRASYGG
jgi:hypothetical protein